MTIITAIRNAVCEICKSEAHIIASGTNTPKRGYFTGGLEYHIYDPKMHRLCKAKENTKPQRRRE